jgi:HIP---CoA ligase
VSAGPPEQARAREATPDAATSEWLATLPPSIPALVRASAERFGETEAVVDGGEQLTFRQLSDRMAEAAAAVMAAGLQPGERAALWAPNSATWIVCALGILAAGGVVVPLNTRFKGAEAGYIVAKSGARLLFAVDEVAGTRPLEMFRDHGGDQPQLERVVVLGATPADPGVAPERGPARQLAAPPGRVEWDDFLDLGRGIPPAQVQQRIAGVAPEDLSDLIFTSGTTGRPKGVMLTHGQSLEVYRSWTEVVGLRDGDRYLIAYPFFHTAGYKSGWLSCVMRGATAVPQPVFDVEQILSKVEALAISVLPGTPTMLQDILDSPQRSRFDLSSLRLTVTGAAVVPVELIRRLRSEMTFDTIITGYGLTETCGTVAMCRHDDDPETIANWSGRALPRTEMAVWDDDGNPVPPGTPGEVVARGYHVTRGYFDEPEETRQAIEPSGWLHTGDIGIMDDRGYVRITDRKKDMFIVGGFNAYPAEIEGIMLTHPAVSQVAVVGVRDHRMGEVGFAFVVLRPGATLDGTELLPWARRVMANYKVPRHVRVVERLPVNATGKVLKYELRRVASEQIETAGPAATPD